MGGFLGLALSEGVGGILEEEGGGIWWVEEDGLRTEDILTFVLGILTVEA